MKKILSFIIFLASFVYISLIVLFGLYGIYGFLGAEFTANMTKLYPYVMAYGGLIIAGLVCLKNLFGKGVLRIIFFVIFILLVAAFILVEFYPSILTSLIKPKV